MLVNGPRQFSCAFLFPKAVAASHPAAVLLKVGYCALALLESHALHLVHELLFANRLRESFLQPVESLKRTGHDDGEISAVFRHCHDCKHSGVAATHVVWHLNFELFERLGHRAGEAAPPPESSYSLESETSLLASPAPP